MIVAVAVLAPPSPVRHGISDCFSYRLALRQITKNITQIIDDNVPVQLNRRAGRGYAGNVRDGLIIVASVVVIGQQDRLVDQQGRTFIRGQGFNPHSVQEISRAA